MNILSIFEKAVEKEASDIHIVPGYYPALRINNQLLYLRDEGVVTEVDSGLLPKTLLNEHQKHFFEENKEIDFGYTHNKVRYRVNLYMTRGLCGGSFRLVPTVIRTIRELNLPELFYDFTTYRQGLILFTGPTGEGKSTSLASIINELNVRDSRHIVTIEDPIEFLYPAARSIISQRELLQDTLSWSASLKSVLREDPDVLLVGEMRDYDTIQSVLTVAETGHLVFSTLHTGSAVEAINRIVDVFPAHQQNQIRNSLASSLIAVVSQRLLPTVNSTGRIPAVEILLNKPSVSALIREGKSFQIDNVIETSESEGMVLFEKYLLKLYTLGHISRDTAHQFAVRKNIIHKLIQ